MTNYEIGDILIYDQTWPGHVLMVYKGGTYHTARVVHAQGFGKNFHVDPMKRKQGNKNILTGTSATVFRPPWGNRDDKELKQQHLLKIADHICCSASYGYVRAARLCVGDKSFGYFAKKRLQKYKHRVNTFQRDIKFVTTVSCAEAVVLCYQLTFDESDPLFPKLDAAHTMPKTLSQYLTGKGWKLD